MSSSPAVVLNGKAADNGLAWDWSKQAVTAFMQVMYQPGGKIRPKEALQAAMSIDGPAIFVAQLELWLQMKAEEYRIQPRVLALKNAEGQVFPLAVDEDLLRFVVLGTVPEDVEVAEAIAEETVEPDDGTYVPDVDNKEVEGT